MKTTQSIRNFRRGMKSPTRYAMEWAKDFREHLRKSAEVAYWRITTFSSEKGW